MKPIVSFVLAVFCVYSSAAPVEWGIIEGGGSTTDGVWVGQYLPQQTGCGLANIYRRMAPHTKYCRDCMCIQISI